MMTHADDPSIPSCKKEISNMSEDEIIALFDWYDFKDPIGHKLTMCADFLNLVKSVVNQKPFTRSEP